MADRITLVKTVAPGAYAADGVALTMAAADVANKNRFVPTGKELVIAYNSNAAATARAVTINSSADQYGRTGDITADSIAAGAYHIYGPFPLDGWKQSGGYIHLEADNAEILFGVVTLP